MVMGFGRPIVGDNPGEASSPRGRIGRVALPQHPIR